MYVQQAFNDINVKNHSAFKIIFCATGTVILDANCIPTAVLAYQTKMATGTLQNDDRASQANV